MNSLFERMKNEGMYDPGFEHDNCGIGAIIDVKGRASHKIVTDALAIVENLEHRAGKDAEGKTGDGVGILTQIPHKYFVKKLKEQGVSLPGYRKYGVGMFFFPQDDLGRRQAVAMFEVIVKKAGLKVLAWRKVDCAPDVLGSRARDCMPDIRQVFIERPEDAKEDIDFDRMLYIIRREFEQSSESTYVPSLSCRTIVYKGMFLVGQLRTFFTDLTDPD
ncbi:MAG: glutamate synthase subunit alpha, partial [Lachnospiraceae bacterium]|nr:glutamate synthase subunit alpha [Lachnospiraceae bacterium]